ncbi:hypothetical protein LEP1GSC039_3101 [Leptospira santarosai str. 2000027870]|uniref:hypothetical protein n=1 Tax=Leptospira santarosai TaxID=28183 RepID=UPI0002BF9C30|nr:hypothetical protein [Leptospira santarosai]EMM88319.1 hypothetical protein LEP1GSC039_3101 [Leptospira santarosai str. 2000027870]
MNQNEKNILTDFIDKLNSLIILLRFSREEIYETLPHNFLLWGEQEEREINYLKYKEQILDSTLILGCSYFENYLQDLFRTLFKNNPFSLPNNKKIEIDFIKRVNTYEEIISHIINNEIHELFYKSISEVLGTLRDKFGFQISDQDISIIQTGFLIRNCLIHNKRLCDIKLSKILGKPLSSNIELSEDEIHSLGLTLRSLSRDLYAQASEKIIF